MLNPLRGILYLPLPHTTMGCLKSHYAPSPPPNPSPCLPTLPPCHFQYIPTPPHYTSQLPLQLFIHLPTPIPPNSPPPFQIFLKFFRKMVRFLEKFFCSKNEKKSKKFCGLKKKHYLCIAILLQ